MEDRYLNNDTCLQRLKQEVKQYGKIVIAFDVDNTIYDYHQTGETFPKVIDLLNKAFFKGHILIAFSAESDIDKIKRRLRIAGVYYNYINENPPFYKSDSRKIYYNILLDDRAGLLSAYNQLSQLLES